MTTQMTVEYFLNYVKNSKSNNTYREYKRGIEAFCEWYDKTANEVLEERRQDWISGDLVRKKRFTRELEKFHKWLTEPVHTIRGKPNQAYSINSARTYCLGIRQLFRFYEMPLMIPTGSEITKTVVSTKDFVPTPDQYRKMFNVAGDLRSKLIISMGKDLAWRIGDFASIKKDEIPLLDREAPILFEKITEKEEVIAKSFLSAETVNLLKRYLPTVKDNPNLYLFPSNREGYFDPESINRILKDLAAKAKIRIPKRKRLRFHAFRKRFLSECANVHVDINTAKLLVGKSVEKDMLTYLSEVEHKRDFIRVHRRLKLTETPMTQPTEGTNELKQLRDEVDKLRRMINIIGAMNPQMVTKAENILKDLGVTMTKATFIEMLRRIDEEKQRTQLEEYKRIIEENNNH